MNPERVSVEVADGLGVLRMVRGERHNAIDLDMARALADGAQALERADGLRAALICAQGPSFTVGGDLAHFAGERHRLAEHLDDMLSAYHDALGRIAALPVPVVCAVQGPVAGGGLGLLWCADLVLAAENVKLVSGFGRLGLSNDAGSSWWLPRLIGLRRAQELLLTARELGAQEALEWGLVTRVVATGRLADEALALGRELAAGPTVALADQRALLRAGTLGSLQEALDRERRTIMHNADTDDARAGVSAFLERRTPRFKGR